MSPSPLRRRFLKALVEDQVFRYAVAGLLGLGKVADISAAAIMARIKGRSSVISGAPQKA